MWSEASQTPRSVWTASAIAATAVHAGIVWWGLTTWQSRRDAIPPAPIQVIALPTASNPPLESVPSAIAAPETAAPEITPETAAPESAPSEPPLAPVAPTDRGPSGSEPAPAPVEPAASQPPTSTPSAPVAPSTPNPPVRQPTPNPPVRQPSSNSPVSPTAPPPPTTPSTPPSPVNSDRPFPVTTGEVSPTNTGVQAFWTLREVPGGSDLPDELPQMPQGWQESTSALLSNAGCSSGLVAPGATARVTLWPVVEADGRISEFLSWDEGGNATVINCIEGLASQIAPLVPARDGGAAIASYAMLLVVEVRGTQ